MSFHKKAMAHCFIDSRVLTRDGLLALFCTLCRKGAQGSGSRGRCQSQHKRASRGPPGERRTRRPQGCSKCARPALASIRAEGHLPLPRTCSAVRRGSGAV